MSLTFNNLAGSTIYEDDTSSSLGQQLSDDHESCNSARDQEDDVSTSTTTAAAQAAAAVVQVHVEPSENELILCGMTSRTSDPHLRHFHECHNRSCLCSFRRHPSRFRSEKHLLVVGGGDNDPNPSEPTRIRLKIRLDSPDPPPSDPPPVYIRNIRASSVNTLMPVLGGGGGGHRNFLEQRRRGSPFTFIETTSIRRKQRVSPQQSPRHKTVIFHRLNSNNQQPQSPPSRYSSSVSLIGFNRVISTNHLAHVLFLFLPI